MMNAPHDSQADLMIIGKWFERIAYGSGADALVRRPDGPVLVVREQDDYFEWGIRPAPGES